MAKQQDSSGSGNEFIIRLDPRKSLEKNAEAYFELAKKAKRKLAGAELALERSRKKLADVRARTVALLQKKEEEKKKHEARATQQWYEKFHWFRSSEGFLVVGGRDATSNEILIKKHTSEEDEVFHTEMSGSPFFIVKTEGKTPGKPTFEEASQAAASYSRAWRLGLNYVDVFHVKPSQVSKTARSGEYVAKGAFVIAGKKDIFKPELRIAVGTTPEAIVMGGAVSAIKQHCPKHVVLVQGKGKKSEIAKKVQRIIGGDLDEIMKAMPPGECDIAKR